MFTGIVTDIGTVEAVASAGDTRVRIATAYDTATVDIGASIACSGVCLTVVDLGPGWFAVDVSGETRARTADQWRAGRRLNLERALRMGDELGGHIVTGHIDGIGTVTGIARDGGSVRVTIAAPPAVAPYVAEKGSVTVDGVSLTVNEVADGAAGTTFGLNIIPHTAAVTTFADLAESDEVNLEIDVLARYLSRLQTYSNTRV